MFEYCSPVKQTLFSLDSRSGLESSTENSWEENSRSKKRPLGQSFHQVDLSLDHLDRYKLTSLKLHAIQGRIQQLTLIPGSENGQDLISVKTRLLLNNTGAERGRIRRQRGTKLAKLTKKVTRSFSGNRRNPVNPRALDQPSTSLKRCQREKASLKSKLVTEKASVRIAFRNLFGTGNSIPIRFLQ
ncbi:hypothetical protein VNO77_20899 [Canavalia gladiata]|uniref:Uncharacterized protein n=1 Tax=Canavalia gladiata TaxID=3824 RepID=A0AAN9QLU1_CANGL